MRIVYVVGTRPNFVKTAPVIGALRERLPAGRHGLAVHWIAFRSTHQR